MNDFFGTNIVDISLLVKDQFPAFYKEHGEGFIDFIKTYYEWLESPDNPIGKSRSLYSQFDIDTTSNEFLNHYREKYMWGLPPELLGNQRLLQKHILELYRSKGSQQATKLLFRLLYNEDIDFYIPSYDIFKLSDNTWVQPKYLEVTYTPHFDRFVDAEITGARSGAKAIVETYESRFIENNVVHLLFISNIVGEFEPDELLITESVPHYEGPSIMGSVVGIEILSAPPILSIGNTLTATNSQFPVEIVISETTSGVGSLSFTIASPGSYYSMDTIIETPITPIGSGAEIRVGALRNTHNYFFVHDRLIDYAHLALNGIYPFPKEPNSNLATIIDDSLMSETITVGEIDRLTVLNPGNGYEELVTFLPIDPYTSTSSIKDNEGNFVGQNALIIGNPSIGIATPSNTNIISSGYHNLNNDQVVFVSDDDPNIQMIGRPIRGAMGHDGGYYQDTKSFLSDDKYLFDGHYYQDFSYVIKAASTLDKYIDILKLISHPAGNAVYGDVRITEINQLYNDAILGIIKTVPVI